MNSESPLPEAVESADVPAAVPDGKSAASAVAPAAEPTVDCAAVLKQLFPKVFGAKAQPLKLGIQADIQARSPGTFSKKALSTFLRRHTANHAYLIAITKSQHRFDLDGEPSGDISAEHREAAQAELTRRRGNREARLVAEQDAKRQRASLLRDFSQTTLTPANFCALRGIAPTDLDALLTVAREEAASEPVQPVRRPEPRRPDNRGRSAPAERGRGPKPR